MSTIQDRLIDSISKLLSESRPYNLMAGGDDSELTNFIRINMIFAPSKHLIKCRTIVSRRDLIPN